MAIGLFTLVRDLTVCWRRTSLPGIPPASCAGDAATLLRICSMVSDLRWGT